MLIPSSLLNALDILNKDLIYLPLGFECSNSYKLIVFHGSISSSNYLLIPSPQTSWIC